MKIRIIDHTGDTVVEVGLDSHAAVLEAERIVEEQLRLGKMAYKVDGPNSGELIRAFDPTASEIVITPRIVGG